MRIIAQRTLREFWEAHSASRASLEAWADHVKQVNWNSPEDLAQNYGQDVLLPDQRAVFKIKGTNFRLVVRINYQQHIVFIRYIGTHAEYNRIDATKI